ncbi:hypothetical protein BDN72DRAFT_841736 [Pluteus cervinus]|uniref:Uncharacterized protein n=1 Tax=Pluteus cervinus TaxID=181527 RepID=A0ACD3AR89_9AGAR|nr:hypothetical protein BDN72DRAFT_841736 [Pluteus cervinus]
MASGSSQIVTLPDIPELYNPNFLDVLLPPSSNPADDVTLTEASPPTNPMMAALLDSAKEPLHTLTANAAPALSSTLNDTLDAFNGLTRMAYSRQMSDDLAKSWKEDKQLTLRIIWNLRSIHDGKGEKEAFYRAWGWLYQHHPRTAIGNLAQLVEPVCTIPKTEKVFGHGYWKDLLNLLVLATVNELDVEAPAKYLHSGTGIKGKPKGVPGGHLKKPRRGRKGAASTPKPKKEEKKEDEEAKPKQDPAEHNARKKAEAQEQRTLLTAQYYESLKLRLAVPKYRALYIAVARLYADQLQKDLSVLDQLDALKAGEDPLPLYRQISLAAKWAPSPSGSHDRHTNIATAIILLLRQAQTPQNYPSTLNNPALDPAESAKILRSFYQRWVLMRLRKTSLVPEPFMAANKWNEIKYNRVPSICMKSNTEHFFKHDPEGFQKYLIAVESGKKKISGATLFPHELVAEAYHLGQGEVPKKGKKDSKYPALVEHRKELALIQLRVIEGQWKALIDRLRESGTIENSIAICDVSGSMGSLSDTLDKKQPSPIFPSVALSLVLASLAKPPFNGGFITFSSDPKFIQLDLTKSLKETLLTMEQSHWEMTTDLNAVFLKLLLPLAVKNNIKQEDMVKRLFIFSDMQFDSSQTSLSRSGNKEEKWKTNYDHIEEAYKAAGYEVPQIVFWDLSAYGTREVTAERKGVAMMNGFSPAMLKVFMGEQEEEEEVKEEDEWEKVKEDGTTETVEKKDEFNPVNVMKKAVSKKSYEGLVVLD